MTIVGTIEIAAATLYSTHHASAADVLAGAERAPALPAYALLVGRARRFTSLATQLHAEVVGALPREATSTARSVFATCHGEIQTADALMTDFHDNAVVSGARFALSVHNSPAGVISVATGNVASTSTVTGAHAIAAGWLEAVLATLDDGQRPVVLSIADEPIGSRLCGPVHTGIAAGFLLRPASSGRRAALAIVPGGAAAPDPLHTLACLVAAAERDDAATIELGSVQPGTILELRVSAR